jgi:hypothetical protein
LVAVIGIQDGVQPIQEHKYAVQVGAYAGRFFAVSQKNWVFWLGKKIVLFFGWRQMRQKAGQEQGLLGRQQRQTKIEMRSQKKSQRNQMKSQRSQMKSQRSQKKN